LVVILDVVYNHFGPDGNYLAVYSNDYLTRERETDWGDSINFDGPNSGPVREFFITNGRYWIDEFHFDGFRFDATHAIRDQSDEYIIGAVGRAAREAAGSRSIILIAEDDLQEAKMVRPRSQSGDDLDGMWNDDFHHSAVVALTGRNEAYYSDYLGAPQEFISAAKYGFLFQSQSLSWRKALRGSATFGIAPQVFVCFIENHDQISNSARGQRLRLETSPGRYRAMTALLLLGPWTPLLFQGEEFGASSPFMFFADVGDSSVRYAIRRGRAEWLAPFLSLTIDEAWKSLPAPDDPQVFARCKLDFFEREENRAIYDLHRDLLKLRREDSRFRLQITDGVDGAVLGPASFVLRYFGKDNDDRLLLINFANSQVLKPASEPLLAAPFGCWWETLWTSESPRYGGASSATIATREQWILPAESTVALRPVHEDLHQR
jgi:maltooligosyltrehalose trehalohydrolase